MADTHATKQLLGLVLPLVRVISDIADEQLSGFSAIMRIVPLLPALGPALRDFKEIPAEYLDLNSSERADLKIFINQQLDLQDDATEAVIEQVLNLVVDLSQVFQALQVNKVVHPVAPV